jgi:hypothetical protein
MSVVSLFFSFWYLLEYLNIVMLVVSLFFSFWYLLEYLKLRYTNTPGISIEDLSLMEQIGSQWGQIQIQRGFFNKEVWIHFEKQLGLHLQLMKLWLKSFDPLTLLDKVRELITTWQAVIIVGFILPSLLSSLSRSVIINTRGTQQPRQNWARADPIGLPLFRHRTSLKRGMY